MYAVLIGALMGFIGSIPVAGPISLLVVAHGTREARLALGIATGGAVAEGAYAYAAFFGLSALLERHPELTTITRVLGAIAMTGLGLYFVIRKSKDDVPEREAAGAFLRGAWLGFAVTIINPSFLATWSAATTVLVTSGLLPTMQPATALPFAAGATAGIVAWFALLIALLRRFGGQLSKRGLDRLVKVIGVLLLGVGAGFAWQAVRGGR